jgi:hypothetical protein
MKRRAENSCGAKYRSASPGSLPKHHPSSPISCSTVFKSKRDPFADPGSNLSVGPSGPAQFVERTDIVEGVDIAADDGCNASQVGAFNRSGWEKWGVGDSLLQVFENGRRLSQGRTVT